MFSFSALSCGPSTDPPQFDLSGGTWHDLSYEFSSETLYWPTADPFRLDTVAFGPTEAGFFYAAFTFSASEHGGTHLDAPIHFSENGLSIDQIPINQLVGPIAVVDVSTIALGNRDYLVSVGDLQSFERTSGRIPDRAMVLIMTGYGQFWPDAEKYLGTTERGPSAVAKLHFPGLHPDAATWLVQNRNVKGIGIDTPSIDYGQSTGFESHQVISGANTLIFENVANLDVLPPKGAWLVAAPMKIAGGSGGPLRLLAFDPR